MGELEDCIHIGCWGGEGGKHWSFKPKTGGFTKIVVRCGDVIDSVSFKSGSEYSDTYGGHGGETNKILLDWPLEYLIGISGTFGPYTLSKRVVINSLCFYTNQRKYGPYGMDIGVPFTFQMVGGGEIVGFMGRYGRYLDAIGLYVKPRVSVCSPTPSNTKDIKLSEVVSKDVPKSPGPWGGTGGMSWDDGVFSSVREVRVSVKKSMVSSVQFLYVNRFDELLWSATHGGPTVEDDHVYKIKLDSSSEYLVGLQGFYGCVEGNDGFEVIKSLTFHTNKEKYGPFGEQIGQGFSSTPMRGKIVGFFGKSGLYLDSIGVHMKYF